MVQSVVNIVYVQSMNDRVLPSDFVVYIDDFLASVGVAGDEFLFVDSQWAVVCTEDVFSGPRFLFVCPSQREEEVEPRVFLEEPDEALSDPLCMLLFVNDICAKDGVEGLVQGWRGVL